MRLKRRIFENYGMESGFREAVINSVTEDSDGRIWAASLANAYRLMAPRMERVPLEARNIWTCLGDRAGGVWFGTYGAGFFRYANGQTEAFTDTTNGVHISGLYTSLFLDRSDTLWIGASDGICEIRNGRAVRREGRPFGAYEFRAMAEAPSGRMFLAAKNNGVIMVEDGRWRPLPREGLGSPRVWSLHVDGNDTLWAGTLGGGLARYKEGRFFTFASGAASGLPSVITAILEDDEEFPLAWIEPRGLPVFAQGAKLFRRRQGSFDVRGPVRPHGRPWQR